MKNITIIYLFVFSAFYTSAKDITAYFSYATFFTKENIPFVETYITVVGNSIEYLKNENGKYSGNVSISLVFKKEGNVVDFKKINLISPEIDDTTQFLPNFIDQQRFSIPNENYNLEISIKDNNSSKEPFTAIQPIMVNYTSLSPTFSDIQPIESYSPTEEPNILSKSGYDLVPYVSNFYPENLSRLKFYSEVYNMDKLLIKGEPYLINYSIQNFESGLIVKDFKKFIKKTASEVDAILGDFNIENLCSGNYYLTIEARNKNNELLIERMLFFQRSNPKMDIINEETFSNIDVENSFVKYLTNQDTLNEFIQSLYPIATGFERNFLRENKTSDNIQFCQKFFLDFWQQRNRLNPELAWSNYQDKLQFVDKKYGSMLRKGYQTDRGRVYLQYGKPNTINEQHYEPNSYPYEIWHYYHAANRNNVKFVFFSRELASNEFELLHSTAYGEIKDYKWQYRLSQRNVPNSIDNPTADPNTINNFGTRSQDYYNLPR